MTNENDDNRPLSDLELEAVSGAGRWVPPTHGNWWVWKQDTTKVTGTPAAFRGGGDISSGIIRSEVINGKRHFYKFDGKKEHLVGIR